jgi:hypothetical protein
VNKNNNIKNIGGNIMFDRIRNSNLACKIQLAMWDAEDKVKEKVKDVKEHPGKTAAKLGVNVVVNTVIPAGRIVNPAVKHVTKKAIDKACDK